MNAKQRKAILEQLETLARFSMGLHTYSDRDDVDDRELLEALEYWESKKKVHRAKTGDGWVLWKLGKG